MMDKYVCGDAFKIVMIRLMVMVIKIVMFKAMAMVMALIINDGDGDMVTFHPQQGCR